jgi:predicted Zn-dependent protease with MMP-like domain
MSDEANMNSTAMCKLIANAMDEAWDKFKPRPKHELIKIEERKPKKVLHKLTDY